MHAMTVAVDLAKTVFELAVAKEILSNVADRESGVIRQPPSGPPAPSGSAPPEG